MARPLTSTSLPRFNRLYTFADTACDAFEALESIEPVLGKAVHGLYTGGDRVLGGLVQGTFPGKPRRP